MRIKDNVKSVYTQIIVLCEIFHISFLFIFKHFSMQIPLMYNIGSVIFYILMLFVVLKGYYRVCIVLVHLEVSAFVTVTVLNGGYSLDFALYLIAMATFVYFNPFKHRSVTYIFSICEVMLYIGLTLHCRHIYSEEEVHIVFVTIYNTVLAVGIILIGAYISDVFVYENNNISVTMTFGIIERDSGKVDDVLLKSADKLLYRGKINGKNVVVKA